MGSFSPELQEILEGRSYRYAVCPFHDDRGRPNLVIYPNGGICFRCGAKASPEELVRLWKEGKLILAERGSGSRSRERIRKTDFESYCREAWAYLWSGEGQERARYLVERGISPLYAKEVGIGYDGQAFVIPLRTGSGPIWGVKLRADPVLGLSWRYRNLPGTRAGLFRPNPRGCPTVVVEGELDALLLSQWGIDASSPSTGVRSLLTLPLPRKALVVPDWDRAGEEVGERLRERGYRVLDPPPWARGAKDLGEAISSLPREERLERVLAWLGRG